MVDLSQIEKIKTTSELDQETAKANARAYLESTNLYVIRKVETGREIPDDIKSLRSEAWSLLQ